MTFVAILFLLLVLPFIAAIIGVGAIALVGVLGVLSMPFWWLLSAFQTNR